MTNYIAAHKEGSQSQIKIGSGYFIPVRQTQPAQITGKLCSKVTPVQRKTNPPALQQPA